MNTIQRQDPCEAALAEDRHQSQMTNAHLHIENKPKRDHCRRVSSNERTKNDFDFFRIFLVLALVDLVISEFLILVATGLLDRRCVFVWPQRRNHSY